MDEHNTVALHTMDENSLEYFAEKYPDEFDSYVDDMAEMYAEELYEYPEDWAV